MVTNQTILNYVTLSLVVVHIKMPSWPLSLASKTVKVLLQALDPQMPWRIAQEANRAGPLILVP